MSKFNFRKGFVDPLSIFGIGFLVVSLLVATLVVNKGGSNFDIRKLASSGTDSGEYQNPQPETTDCPTKCATSPNIEACLESCAKPTNTCTPEVIRTGSCGQVGCTTGTKPEYKRTSDCEEVKFCTSDPSCSFVKLGCGKNGCSQKDMAYNTGSSLYCQPDP